MKDMLPLVVLPAALERIYTIDNLPVQAHLEGPQHGHHLEAMTHPLDSPSAYPVIPERYRQALTDPDHRAFFEAFILFHDIGKLDIKIKEITEEGNVFQLYAGHEQASYERLLREPRLLDAVPGALKPLLLEAVRLHGKLYFVKGLAEGKVPADEDLDAFMNEVDLSLAQKRAAVELLIAADFLDTIATERPDPWQPRVVNFSKAFERWESRNFPAARLADESDLDRAKIIVKQAYGSAVTGWVEFATDPMELMDIIREQKNLALSAGPRPESARLIHAKALFVVKQIASIYGIPKSELDNLAGDIDSVVELIAQIGTDGQTTKGAPIYPVGDPFALMRVATVVTIAWLFIPGVFDWIWNHKILSIVILLVIGASDKHRGSMNIAQGRLTQLTEAFAEHWTALLIHPDRHSRLQAVKTLGQVGTAEALPALRAALQQARVVRDAESAMLLQGAIRRITTRSKTPEPAAARLARVPARWRAFGLAGLNVALDAGILAGGGVLSVAVAQMMAGSAVLAPVVLLGSAVLLTASGFAKFALRDATGRLKRHSTYPLARIAWIKTFVGGLSVVSTVFAAHATFGVWMPLTVVVGAAALMSGWMVVDGVRDLFESLQAAGGADRSSARFAPARQREWPAVGIALAASAPAIAAVIRWLSGARLAEVPENHRLVAVELADANGAKDKVREAMRQAVVEVGEPVAVDIHLTVRSADALKAAEGLGFAVRTNPTADLSLFGSVDENTYWQELADHPERVLRITRSGSGRSNRFVEIVLRPEAPFASITFDLTGNLADLPKALTSPTSFIDREAIGKFLRALKASFDRVDGLVFARAKESVRQSAVLKDRPATLVLPAGEEARAKLLGELTRPEPALAGRAVLMTEGEWRQALQAQKAAAAAADREQQRFAAEAARRTEEAAVAAQSKSGAVGRFWRTAVAAGVLILLGVAGLAVKRLGRDREPGAGRPAGAERIADARESAAARDRLRAMLPASSRGVDRPGLAYAKVVGSKDFAAVLTAADAEYESFRRSGWDKAAYADRHPNLVMAADLHFMFWGDILSVYSGDRARAESDKALIAIAMWFLNHPEVLASDEQKGLVYPLHQVLAAPGALRLQILAAYEAAHGAPFVTGAQHMIAAHLTVVANSGAEMPDRVSSLEALKRIAATMAPHIPQRRAASQTAARVIQRYMSPGMTIDWTGSKLTIELLSELNDDTTIPALEEVVAAMESLHNKTGLLGAGTASREQRLGLIRQTLEAAQSAIGRIRSSIHYTPDQLTALYDQYPPIQTSEDAERAYRLVASVIEARNGLPGFFGGFYREDRVLPGRGMVGGLMRYVGPGKSRPAPGAPALEWRKSPNSFFSQSGNVFAGIPEDPSENRVLLYLNGHGYYVVGLNPPTVTPVKPGGARLAEEDSSLSDELPLTQLLDELRRQLPDQSYLVTAAILRQAIYERPHRYLPLLRRLAATKEPDWQRAVEAKQSRRRKDRKIFREERRHLKILKKYLLNPKISQTEVADSNGVSRKLISPLVPKIFNRWADHIRFEEARGELPDTDRTALTAARLADKHREVVGPSYRDALNSGAFGPAVDWVTTKKGPVPVPAGLLAGARRAEPVGDLKDLRGVLKPAGVGDSSAVSIGDEELLAELRTGRRAIAEEPTVSDVTLGAAAGGLSTEMRVALQQAGVSLKKFDHLTIWYPESVATLFGTENFAAANRFVDDLPNVEVRTFDGEIAIDPTVQNVFFVEKAQFEAQFGEGFARVGKGWTVIAVEAGEGGRVFNPVVTNLLAIEMAAAERLETTADTMRFWDGRMIVRLAFGGNKPTHQAIVWMKLFPGVEAVPVLVQYAVPAGMSVDAALEQAALTAATAWAA